MFQIDNQSAAESMPAPTEPETPGFFTDGNPVTGTQPTILPAEFMNMLMMEVINVLVDAGIDPDKVSQEQLAEAINIIAVNKASSKVEEHNDNQDAHAEYLAKKEHKHQASDITDFSNAVSSLYQSSFIGATGWRKTPDGFLEQWGRATGVLDNNSQCNLTFTLPMSYSNINYIPNATIEWNAFVSDTWGVTMSIISSSQVSVRADNVNGLTPKNTPINFLYQIRGKI